MKKLFVFLALLVATLLYILFFPLSIQEETFLEPVWVQNVQHPKEMGSGSADSVVMPFTLFNNVYGYISDSGELYYLNQSKFNVAISDHLFADYSRISDNIVFRKPDGRIHMNIKTSGYPFFLNQRMYTIDSTMSGIVEWDSDENILWSRKYGSHITAVDNCFGFTLVGLLDGRLILHNDSGEEVYRFISDRSSIKTIYGCSISFDGSFIALIAGAEPQRILLIQRKESGYTSVLTRELDTNFRRNVKMQFTEDGKRVYFEGDGKIFYIDTLSKKIDSYPFPVSPLSIYPGLRDEPFWILGNEENGKAILRMYLSNKKMALDAEFYGPATYFNKIDDQIYIGAGYSIMRLDVRSR